MEHSNIYGSSNIDEYESDLEPDHFPVEDDVLLGGSTKRSPIDDIVSVAVYDEADSSPADKRNFLYIQFASAIILMVLAFFLHVSWVGFLFFSYGAFQLFVAIGAYRSFKNNENLVKYFEDDWTGLLAYILLAFSILARNMMVADSPVVADHELSEPIRLVGILIFVAFIGVLTFYYKPNVRYAGISYALSCLLVSILYFCCGKRYIFAACCHVLIGLTVIPGALFFRKAWHGEIVSFFFWALLFIASMLI